MKYLMLRENTLHWGSGGRYIMARDQGPETQCEMGKHNRTNNIRIAVF